MKNNPLVSILIPVYNAQEYLHGTIDSLLIQTYTNIEIIFVNDGSTDESLNILKELEEKNTNIIVHTQENKGACAARNKAYRMANGTYIQYFDADDLIHPEKIASQIKALYIYNFHPTIVATGKWMKFHQDISTSPILSQSIDKNYDDSLLYFKESWETREYIIGQSWLIHKDLHRKVGLWNENLTLDDDGEFFARVAYASSKMLFIKNSLVYWRQDNPTSISKDPSYKAMLSRLNVFDSYFCIVMDNVTYIGLQRALVIKYSDHLLHTYFKYPNIAKEIIHKISLLGYKKPLYPKSPKLSFMINFLGVKISFFLLRIKLLISSS